MSIADAVAAEPLGAEQASFLDRMTDRMSPILVKEVRQAMRGKYFKVTFWVTLLVATMVGLGVCLEGTGGSHVDESLGRPFFAALFGCLVVATQVLVPFSAFQSMGGEWDENTWDLLVLSNLRPRQIVFGKVFAAGVQAMLYYSAFGPFLVFAFLLQGVDLGVLFASLGLSFVMSTLLSSVAVAMSCFGRGKFSRVILMVLLTGSLAWGAIITIGWASSMMFRPTLMYSSDMLEGLGAALTIALAATGFSIAAAASRLAHQEENRSSALRAMSLVVVACGICWATWVLGAKPGYQELVITACACITFLWVVSLFFSTEEERLGLRVGITLPKSRIASWLMLPILPGGARGLVFFIGSSLAVIAWMVLYSRVASGSSPFRHGAVWMPIVLMSYGILYLGIPGGLLFKLSNQLWVRHLARASVILFFLCSLILPALVGYLFDYGGWGNFKHPGNIFLAIEHLARHDMVFGKSFVLMLCMLGFTLLVNLPRMFGMLKEHHSTIAKRQWMLKQAKGQ